VLKTRARALNQIGKLYDHTGDYETALPYLEQSLAVYQKIGDKAGASGALNNISAIHHTRGIYDQALAYLEQELVISREIGDRSGMCATLFNMGHLSLQKENQP